ncbi:MAG TPA: NUDIX hydrolase [Patescibacteria group bacterium]
MNTYYQATPESPYHLSAGAVLINDKNEVLAHHFTDFRGFDSFYHIMNETVESGETLEQALHRGLLEEYGATGEIVTYLGSYQSNFHEDGYDKNKTTIYFLVHCISQSEDARLKGDPEGDTKLEWLHIDFLIEEMKKQKLSIREDIDQSLALERAKSYLERK